MKTQLSRRDFLRASAGVVAGSLVAACSAAAPGAGTEEGAPAAGEAIELSVATSDGEISNGIDAQLPLYLETSGNKVNFTKIPGADFQTKITADLASGTGFYDVIIQPFLFLHSHAAAGLLTPIDDFVQADPDIDLEDFIPLLLESHGLWDGKLYSLPYKADAYVFFYRKDLFGDPAVQDAFNSKTGREMKVPETITELIETARFFTKEFNPDSPTEFGWAHMAERDNGAMWIWASRMAVYGGSYLTEEFLPGFDNEAGSKAMEYAIQLNETCPPDVGSYGWEESNTAYLTGKVAMMEQWPGLSKMAETEEGFWGRSEVIGKTGYAVPAGDIIDGNLIRSSVLGGWACAVSAYADDKPLAYDFIKFVTGKEAEPLKIPAGNDPCRRSTYADPEIAAANPLYPTLLGCLEEARITADIDAPPVSDEIQEILRTNLHRVWIGELEGQAALDNTVDEWMPILERSGLLS
jgi:multiple sugar transport system substrate-binding protein